MKTIEEKNIMLAQFMGLEFEDGQERIFMPGLGSKLLDGTFNESWDWLMPVVEKIENLGISEIGGRIIYSRFVINHNQITLNWCRNNRYQFKLEVLPEWMTGYNGNTHKEYRRVSVPNQATKFDALYQAVVAFVKWFNENSKI